MPKITDLLAAVQDEVHTAIEFFPPRTPEGVQNLYKRFASFAQQKPIYADVTWGAGGSTSDLTLELCIKMKEEYGMEPNMHLTCTNMPVELITAALEGAKSKDIRNIVALRGDPPKGQDEWKATEGGFSCALDLVKHIRAVHGDYFCISVAGYPEGHPTVIKKVAEGRTLSESEEKRVVTLEDGDYVCSDADYAGELAYLKAKVDAGADFIITQMFFDTAVFIEFAKACRAIGITVPIMPGIMLIQNYGGFNRMAAFCKSRVPAALRAEMDAVKDDDAAVLKAGIAFGVRTCRELIASGQKGLHFYTLNTETVTLAILDELELKK